MPTFEETADFSDAFCTEAKPKAIRVKIGDRVEWIPQSQVDDRSEVWAPGQRGKLIIALWIAEQKGLV